MAQLKLDPLEAQLFTIDGLVCYNRKGQKLRSVCWGGSPTDGPTDFGMHEYMVQGLLSDSWLVNTLRRSKSANLAEEVLGEAIRSCATSLLETDEKEQKKLVLRALPGKQISDKDRERKALRLKEALDQLEQRGCRATVHTYASLLRQCADAKALSEGRRLHTLILKNGYSRNRFLENLLVQMYGNCGNLEDARVVFDNIRQPNAFSGTIMIAVYIRNGHLEVARSVFDRMSRRDVVSWTTMIAAYSQNGRGKEALNLFGQMNLENVKPDKIAFISVLDACLSLEDGKRIHAYIVECGFESDVVVGNTLIDMYGKCGSLSDARNVFDKMPQRDVVSWTAMVTAYAQNGDLEVARSMFDMMPQRDAVSWTAMITGYAKHGRGKEALELFRLMELEGMRPTKITFIVVLDACASLAAVAEGKRIHASIADHGYKSDVVVTNALIYMYGKCGSSDDARTVFDKMYQRDVISWNAMIAAYAQDGRGKEALELFSRMDREGPTPDWITFISVLFACNHAGLLDVGWYYFVSMSRDHDITPTTEHYGCMIDLIGRAGQVDEAVDLVKRMPSQPDYVAWMALLSACRMFSDVERGTLAAKHAFKLDPKNAAPYILLSNIYAADGRWDDVGKVRQAMEDRGVKKHPGLSCIEVQNFVHEFVVGNMSHPQKEEILAELQSLNSQLKESGYMPDTKAVLCDMEDEKEHLLCYHSEKLAIAFGLISTPAGATLHIIKNLRVCSDCHAATKFISKIVERRIIVRDANRFHHFEHGVCSCGDYW